MDLKPGDVVILKSGGHPITVAEVNGDTIVGVWMGGEGDLFRETLPMAVLELAEIEVSDEEGEEEGEEDDESDQAPGEGEEARSNQDPSKNYSMKESKCSWGCCTRYLVRIRMIRKGHKNGTAPGGQSQEGETKWQRRNRRRRPSV